MGKKRGSRGPAKKESDVNAETTPDKLQEVQDTPEAPDVTEEATEPAEIVAETNDQASSPPGEEPAPAPEEPTPRTSSDLATADPIPPSMPSHSQEEHEAAYVEDNDDDEREGMSLEDRLRSVKAELEATKQERETLGNQYRGLLGKLTGMRTTLGDKLKEDAEELDRRETQISTLSADNEHLHEAVRTLGAELTSVSQEASALSSQLAQLRSQSDSSSSDVLSLTREMRELRGEMERLRLEREEWEIEAGKERARREEAEEEMRLYERRDREMGKEMELLREERDEEKERADNLQEVLSEFQAAKDSELQQATAELETQLRLAATSLSEFKLRAANAETRLSEVSNDASRSAALEKELKEKNHMIGKLRHDSVVTNEHLTEALRRLRKNQSENNVDRRLVTNILLSFLLCSRGDTKRFEMLSLLSTILSWDDTEREKAGLQRQGNAAKSKAVEVKEGKEAKERSAEEEAAMNESFSNLFVEFLLKEASQGQPARPAAQSASEPNVFQRTQSSSSISHDSPYSPPSGPGGGGFFSPPLVLPGYSSPKSRPRGLSTSSNVSDSSRVLMGGRKASHGHAHGLRDVLEQ